MLVLRLSPRSFTEIIVDFLKISVVNNMFDRGATSCSVPPPQTFRKWNSKVNENTFVNNVHFQIIFGWHLIQIRQIIWIPPLYIIKIFSVLSACFYYSIWDTEQNDQQLHNRNRISSRLFCGLPQINITTANYSTKSK